MLVFVCVCVLVYVCLCLRMCACICVCLRVRECVKVYRTWGLGPIGQTMFAQPCVLQCHIENTSLG
jgi:hypothetical protein